MPGRPVSIATRVIEAHPDAELEKVNALLREAGDEEIDQDQLERRKRWIATRDQYSSSRKAKRKSSRKAPKRSSPNTPKPGSASEFICGLPYDLPAGEAWRMALEAGYDCQSKNISQARSRYPNLRKRHKLGEGERLLNEPEWRAELIAKGAARRERAEAAPSNGKRASKPPAPRPTANGSNGSNGATLVHAAAVIDQARAELAHAVMKAGLTVAEQVIADLKSLNANLYRGVNQ